MAPVHGYWKLRGLGQTSRLILAYAGVDYEDKQYTMGTEAEPSEWFNEKYTLGLDFPNLPYYIDDDVKLSQANAIASYLSRKHGLEGSNESEKQKLDMLYGVHQEIKMRFTMMAYGDYDNLKAGYLKYQATVLKQLSDSLGSSQWFAGEKITYIDFLIYELLDILVTHESTSLDGLENLSEYLKRFENLPNIAKYMESDKFIKYPINGSAAKWGGK